MKDPIEEYEKQSEKLDEIFGFLRRAFGNKPSTTPSSFLDAMKRYQDTDTDTDCAKMDVGKKLNRKVAGTSGSAGIVIGQNKISNIKGIRFELLDAKGMGTGKFDTAIVNDFKCYDLDKDIYGIKWLFDDNASYEAESISGDLKAGVRNQTFNFKGKWNAGKFFGRFFSSPEDFKGIAAPTATFAFFDYNKTATKASTKGKTKKRSAAKKGTAKGTPPPPLGSTPATPTTTPPSPPPAAGTAPVATPPLAPTGKKGKPSKRMKLPESKSNLTFREFLESFM